MGEIFVFIIVGISVVYVVRKLYLSFKNDSIDSGCQGCSGCENPKIKK
ncbi:MAG: FeoB-associated Cys-rich membrane protein [Desulforegulaceae bacterium]|nr:FeoB-associated Cys-rich membrane protein [Desulforegulaceae bacterium]